MVRSTFAQQLVLFWLWTACAAAQEQLAYLPPAANQTADKLHSYPVSNPMSNRVSGVGSVGDWNEVVPTSYYEFDDPSAGGKLPSCPETCAGFFGGAALLNWAPHTGGLDYALSEDSSSLTVGRARVHHVDYEDDLGIRAMLGYRTATGWAVSMRATAIDFDGSSSVVRPANIGQLFATRSHPDGNEEADRASATASLNLSVLDLEMARNVVASSFADWSIFGAFRWAEIDQVNQYFYDGRDFVEGAIREDLSVDGFGLQFGSQGIWHLAHGFGLFGRASGGLLRAGFDTHRRETNLNDALTLVDVTDYFDQALPNVELATGISWSRGGLSVLCAYELINWFNAYDRAVFVDDIHEATYGPFSKDILLDGITLSLSYSR